MSLWARVKYSRHSCNSIYGQLGRKHEVGWEGEVEKGGEGGGGGYSAAYDGSVTAGNRDLNTRILDRTESTDGFPSPIFTASYTNKISFSNCG